MPDWLSDLGNIGSIASIVGLFITIWLLIEARKIRDSFMRRARLPEINRDLTKCSSTLSRELKNWKNDKHPSIETLSTIKALLENIEPKLPIEEKRKVGIYLAALTPKKHFFSKQSLSEISEEAAWQRYTELSGLITALKQLDKDSKWN